jgi:hypothetical protein
LMFVANNYVTDAEDVISVNNINTVLGLGSSFEALNIA